MRITSQNGFGVKKKASATEDATIFMYLELGRYIVAYFGKKKKKKRKHKPETNINGSLSQVRRRN